MKKVLFIALLATSTLLRAQDLPKSEFNFSLGYMFEGEMYLWYPDKYASVGETYLFKLEYLFFPANAFGLGGYANYASPHYDGYGGVNMVEFGLALKGRFKAGEQFVIEPGLQAGFRSYGEGAGTGFGLNGSVAIQYQLESVRPFIDIGILGQPAGGNNATDITFSPVFQLSVGICL